MDTCVLLDLLLEEPQWAARAETALRDAYGRGRLTIGEVVYAELLPQFRNARELDEVLGQMGITFVPSSPAMAAAAGQAWGEYRRRRGPHERVIGDFLVAAHAQVNADRLLTRDARFYRQSMAGLAVREP